MFVEEILALMRLVGSDDKIIANVARGVLSLVERVRDAELRADLAEASLESEGAKLAAVRTILDVARTLGRSDELLLSLEAALGPAASSPHG